MHANVQIHQRVFYNLIIFEKLFLLRRGLDLNLHIGLGKSKTPVAGSTELAAQSLKRCLPETCARVQLLLLFELEIKFFQGKILTPDSPTTRENDRQINAH